GDDLRRGAGGEIEAAKEFLARALDGALQLGDACRIGIGKVGLGRGGERVGVRLHGGKVAQERLALLPIQAPIVGKDLTGDGNARGLAAAREQSGGEFTQTGSGARATERAGQKLATLLGDRAKQLLEKRHVHRNGVRSNLAVRPGILAPATEYNNLAVSRVP